jgi:hypothetical protein
VTVVAEEFLDQGDNGDVPDDVESEVTVVAKEMPDPGGAEAQQDDVDSEDGQMDPLVDDTLVDAEGYIPVAPTQEQLTNVVFEPHRRGRYSGILVDGAKYRYQIHRQVYGYFVINLFILPHALPH